jgi:hypothetical protein
MFEDSDLLQHDVLVLRFTAPPDAQFSVLDETGREIGRVVAEGGLVREEPARLALYDRQHTPVLVVERFERYGRTETRYIDGRGQPIDNRLIRMKLPGLFSKRPRPRSVFTLTDSRKAEVAGVALALPPEGDHRLGVTFLLTITAEPTSDLRLAALALAITFTENMSRSTAWLLKKSPKAGQPWPGSASEALTR